MIITCYYYFFFGNCNLKMLCFDLNLLLKLFNYNTISDSSSIYTDNINGFIDVLTNENNTSKPYFSFFLAEFKLLLMYMKSYGIEIENKHINELLDLTIDHKGIDILRSNFNSAYRSLINLLEKVDEGMRTTSYFSVNTSNPIVNQYNKILCDLFEHLNTNIFEIRNEVLNYNKKYKMTDLNDDTIGETVYTNSAMVDRRSSFKYNDVNLSFETQNFDSLINYNIDMSCPKLKDVEMVIRTTNNGRTLSCFTNMDPRHYRVDIFINYCRVLFFIKHFDICNVWDYTNVTIYNWAKHSEEDVLHQEIGQLLYCLILSGSTRLDHNQKSNKPIVSKDIQQSNLIINEIKPHLRKIDSDRVAYFMKKYTPITLNDLFNRIYTIIKNNITSPDKLDLYDYTHIFSHGRGMKHLDNIYVSYNVIYSDFDKEYLKTGRTIEKIIIDAQNESFKNISKLS